MPTVTIVIFALMLSFIAFPLSATAQGPDSIPEKAQVVSALGKIPGRDLIVHVWVVVPPGADKNQAAIEALRNQGARPFTPEEFSTVSLFWDQFSDGVPGNDFVTQNYNPNNDPTVNNGLTALKNTYTTWNSVPTSGFIFQMGDENTTRCPSLVQECPGPQTFDGNNDVAWLQLAGSNTLGVAWFGTSIDEVDIALNTQFTWNTNGNDFDVETVYLHENGHALGLGHSNVVGAIMEPAYDGVQRLLHPDDVTGITFLYPVVNSAPSVTISSPAAPVTINVGDSQTFTGTASDAEDGDVTLSLVWVSDLDGQIGTGGSFSTTALTAGVHIVTATATDSLSATGNAVAPAVTVNAVVVSPVGVAPEAASKVEGSDSATSLTLAGFNPSGADRVAIILASNFDRTAIVTSVTRTGDTPEFVGRIATPAGEDNVVEIWKIVAPTTGAADVVITWDIDDDVCGSVINYNGVDQTTPTENFTTQTQNTDDPSMDVTSAVGDYVVGVMASTEAEFTVGAGQTSRLSQAPGDHECEGSDETGAATVAMSWSGGSGEFYAHAGINLKAAAAGPPPSPNDPPLANNDSDTVAEGGSTITNVLTNDLDADDGIDVTTVAIVANGANGQAVPDAVTGTITYTHNGSETASDTYTYTVKDNAGNTSNVATVAITVANTNDPPVVTITSPASGSSVIEGTSQTFTASATDEEDNDTTLTASISWSSDLTGPLAGTGGSISETLAVGVHTITASATDSGTASDSDSITFTVTANVAPTAVNDADNVAKGGSVTTTVLTNDSDPDDGIDVTTVAIVANGANGQAVPDAVTGTITYTHNGSETTSDSYTYTVNDNSGQTSNAATVTITVTPVNDPPVITINGANPQVIELGTPYSELGATASDDIDGDLTSSIVIDSSSVNTNAVGSYIVTYSVADSAGNTASATRTVEVVDTTAPLAPTITNPADSSTVNTSIITISGTAEPNSTVDISIDSISFGTTTADGAGIWSLNSPTLSDGPHSITATATDQSQNTSLPSTISFTIDTTVTTDKITITSHSMSVKNKGDLKFKSNVEANADGQPNNVEYIFESKDGLIVEKIKKAEIRINGEKFRLNCSGVGGSTINCNLSSFSLSNGDSIKMKLELIFNNAFTGVNYTFTASFNPGNSMDANVTA